MTTKVVDSKGRVPLGVRFAGRTVIVDDSSPDRIIIMPAVVVPEREAWLYQNAAARAAVRRGLAQAAKRRFSKAPPDVARDAKLAARLSG